MSDHGAHFDVFTQQTGGAHGGAEYDLGFSLQAQADPHGQHFDRFTKSGGVTKHGERWDEFGWQEMPRHHGRNFDDSFGSPTANTGPHGTWFDVFSGGTQLRYLSDGNSEYEAVVVDLDADHAVVERKDGKREEIELAQILMWRDGVATDINADAEPDRPAPGMPEDAARGGAIASLNTESIPRSDAEAPSAHSATAAGGGERQTIDPQVETPVLSLKVVGDVTDVGKLQVTGKAMKNAVEAHSTNLAHIANGDYGKVKCPSCGTSNKDGYDIGHTPMHGSSMGKSKMFGSCRSCGFGHTFPPPKSVAPKRSKLAKTDDDELDVAKSVDSSETAVQSQDLEGKPGNQQAGANWCPHCQHTCRKVEDGKCPTCGGPVRVKKTQDTLAELRKMAGV